MQDCALAHPSSLPACHSENVALALPCNNCDRMDCSNKLQTSAAEARPSELLPGEDGLFAARHIKRGEWIASFGVLARLDGGVGGRAKRGYIIPITETGSRRLVYVTPIDGVGPRHKAHAMNHTCSEEHRNAELTHTGEIGLDAQVLVRACKDITANQEIFTSYGRKDQIGFFDRISCRCHACCQGLLSRAE